MCRLERRILILDFVFPQDHETLTSQKRPADEFSVWKECCSPRDGPRKMRISSWETPDVSEGDEYFV